MQQIGHHIQNIMSQLKKCNAMIHEINFFDQPINSDKKTNDNIWKIENGQRYDYITVVS